ncbi:MAG: hypothetical protein WA730_19595, partial [Pseudolabrys sp.]
MAGAKSSLKPRATNNFAIMNIGPISMCIGLSNSAGLRRSKLAWPIICKAQPAMNKPAAMNQTAGPLTWVAITVAAKRSRTTATD